MLFLPILVTAVFLSGIEKEQYTAVYRSSRDAVCTYLLGHTVDRPGVVTAVLAIREVPDILSEECLEFSHEPKQRHVAHGVDEVVVVDNDYVVPIITPENYNFSVASWVDDTTQARPLEAGTWNEIQDIPDIARGQVPVAGSVATCSDISRANQVFVRCQDVVEVKNHRRIGTHKHEDYVRSVVATLKVTFGCPAENAANKLAVRRSAKHIMLRHTVRHTDIARIIDRVVAGVFIPNEHELLAAQMMQSNTNRRLRDELQFAGPQSFWQQLWHPFTRGRYGLEERG